MLAAVIILWIVGAVLFGDVMMEHYGAPAAHWPLFLLWPVFTIWRLALRPWSKS